ncbi:MAG: hypothetical protein B7Z12_17400, partial [Caulobacter vibrioides]
PLSRAEVARRDDVTGWLRMVADPLDAKLLWLATADYARGEPAPGWKRMRGVLGLGLTTPRLLWRYRKALAAVTCSLRGVPMDGVIAKRMASTYQPRQAD